MIRASVAAASFKRLSHPSRQAVRCLAAAASTATTSATTVAPTSSSATSNNTSISTSSATITTIPLLSRKYYHASSVIQPAIQTDERGNVTTKTTFNLPDPAAGDDSEQLEQQRDSLTGRPLQRLQLTKIVATIGPTSEQQLPLQSVAEAGMRIMRLNFSHATKEEVELRVKNLALAQEALAVKTAGSVSERQDVRAILLDTKGPEIRSGKLRNDFSGHETITLTAGNKITLHTDPKLKDEGSTETDLYIDYPSLHKAVQPGRKVLLDDGTITLTVETVESRKDKHGKVTCRIENTAELRSRAGVNLPLADTSDLPAMSEKDKADILYGMTDEVDVDYVAASFVQTGAAVREIRRHMEACAKQLNWSPDRPLPRIISKIETAGALTHFDDILAESDGIMVARGDLGVEIPLTQVTNAQKEMVAACNAVGKPVIVATQMLESMAKNPRPTRAEVSDVTNAVYDGADCVMLSGETAKGKYPTEAVRTMNEIILAAERYASSGALGHPVQSCTFVPPKTDDAAIAKAAVTAAAERNCTAILVLTNYGTLPRLVSAYRPAVPIFAFCPSAKIGRQLQLYRGVHPIVGLQGVSGAKRPQHALNDAKYLGHVKPGDEVIIVSMEDEGMGRTGSMKIATVP